jgi:hypothetical protein
LATASRHWWLFGDRTRATPGRDDTEVARRGQSRRGIGADDLDPALDLVARMLRLIGEVPVLPDQPHLDALRHTCETWARHVLTGTAAPGTTSVQGGHRAGRPSGSSWWCVATPTEMVASSLADLRRPSS